MPNYDYQCEKCGNIFEVFQSMNDKKLTKCPDASCRGQVSRLLGTGAGIIFKGSGFYGTDYRSESYKAGEKAEQNSGKADKGKSSDKKKDPAKKSSSSSAKTD
ncbi:MAG: zinc ribbon domain-containing protein [Verrucomicrobiaceae bacterium]|nr:zinc ribbon domain-containing protein [Verrucomicrobiaceae bacterium]